MAQHPTQQSASSTEPLSSEGSVDPASPWPWWLKVGAAITLAAIWIVILAKPALGHWR